MHWGNSRAKSRHFRQTWPTRFSPFVALALLAGLLSMTSQATTPTAYAAAASPGDGLALYSVAGNSTPQTRTWTQATSSFGAALPTASGAVATDVIVRTSPVKQEAIAAYQTSDPTNYQSRLSVLCFNGATWSNEWSVVVGGAGSSTRFDIAYETASGDVMVVYGNNQSTTNQLGYRTKAGTSDCSAGWSAATSLTTQHTTKEVAQVRLAADRRPNSNMLAVAWSDWNTTTTPESASLSAMMWNGSTWSAEPTTALETDLKYITNAFDSESFDIDFESASGDVLLAWGKNVASGANGVRYATCVGGTAACAWSTALTPPTFLDDATVVSLAANPVATSNEMVSASIGNAQSDLQLGYWDGSAWTNTANADTTALVPVTRSRTVAAAWVSNGSTTRSVITYGDGTNPTTDLSWFVGNGGTFTAQTDYTLPGKSAPAYLDVVSNPFHPNQAVITYIDQNQDWWTKRIALDTNGTFSFSDIDNNVALETNIAQKSPTPFSFAFWQHPPIAMTQSAYRWYATDTAQTPTKPLAPINSAAQSTRTPLRLRAQTTTTQGYLDANSRAFRLQYATSTNGPWSEVTPPAATDWWNATWSKRQRITFDNTSRSENLLDFPVMIKLDPSSIDYSALQSGGQDLRFVDNGVVLNYQIEQWNTSGTSIIWLRVPQIDASSSTDFVWMYYGNATAPSGQNAAATWNSNYRAVFHYNDTSNASFSDSTSYGNAATPRDATGVTANVTGQVGSAVQLNAYKPLYRTTDSGIPHKSAFTAEMWVRSSSSIPSWAMYLSDDGADNQPNASWPISAGPVVGGICLQANNGTCTQAPANSVVANAWNHIVVTHDGTTASIYVNGAVVASRSDAPFKNLTSSGFTIFTANIVALVDETRISTGARSAGWVSAVYQSESSASFVTIGPVDDASPTSLWRYIDQPSLTNGSNLTTSVLGSSVLQSYVESSPTPLNPNASTASTTSEWDFSLDATYAPTGTYVFRMISGDGTTFDAYEQYPTIVIGPTISPGNYRFFAHVDSTSVGTPLAPQSQSATAPPPETPFRLRQRYGISGGSLATGTPTMKLQYSLKSGTCDSGFVGESYADVTTSTALRFHTAGSVVDGTALTPNVNDPTGTGTLRVQSVERSNAFSPIATAQSGDDVMWDFVLVNATATPGTTYCFRTVYENGLNVATSTAVAELSIPVLNVKPNDAITLSQTVTGTNGWTTASTVTFGAKASDPDANDMLKLCVEVKPLGQSFASGSETCMTNGVTTGGANVETTLSLEIGGMAANTQYHWRAYVKDGEGLASAWTTYGTNDINARDFGVDPTAPTGGVVLDGSSPGVDITYGEGSLSSLSANWSGFDTSIAGIWRYEYSIGTSPGGTTTKNWTSANTATNVTATGLLLSTDTSYYVNVRAVDQAGNVSAVVSSDGQLVAPTVSLSLSTGSISFDALGTSNAHSASTTATIDAASNAKNGFVVYGKLQEQPTNGIAVIPQYDATWNTPAPWSGTGFGYTTSDPLVLGSDRFGVGAGLMGTKYARIETVGAGSVFLDESIAGSSSRDVLFRVSVPSEQSAGNYTGSIVFSCIASY